MTFTVRRLLADTRLGLQLVSGAAGIDRTIKWGHVIELVDPTRWLTGGELVMATGLWLPDDAAGQREYLRRLDASGAAALALGIGTVHPSVPPAVRDEGDKLGFPVLSVAAELPFVAIGRGIRDALTADDIIAAKKVVDHQQRLARAALTGGIPAVSEALAQALGASVVVLDAQSAILASAGRNWTHQKTQALIARRRSGRRGSPSAHVGEDGYVLSQSLGVAGVRRGTVLVVTADALDARHRLLVSHAVTLMSIELEKPAAVLTVEGRLRAALLQALLDGLLDNNLSHLRYFGFTPESEVIAMVFDDVGPMIVANQLLDQILADAGTPFLSMAASDMLVVLLPVEENSDLPEHVYASLRQQLKRSISGGAGTRQPLGEAVASHRQALAAARNAQVEGRRLVRFDELSTYSLLLGSQSRETLTAVAASALGPIEHYDRMRNGDLVRSLETYLTYNGQWEAAAASIGVHRHTLRNRMAKVTDLLGRDIESAHVRAELWLAVKARELLRLEAPSR